MGQDIFKLDHPDSYPRVMLDQAPIIDVRTLNLPPYELREGYDVQSLRFVSDEEVQPALKPLQREIEAAGYTGGLFTGVFEAVLNAFQHGNKRDPTKDIILAKRILPERFDVGVIDQGGRLDARLASYILLHRTEPGKLPDFYTFAGKERTTRNEGVGTKFMHIYFDKVRYFRSENAGLAVHLTKYRPQ